MTENQHEPGDGWSNTGDQPTEPQPDEPTPDPGTGDPTVPPPASDSYGDGGVDTVEFYRRETDEKWAWRYMSANHVDVLATDGGQGYENEADARAAAGRVTGFASEVKTARRGLRFETVEA